MIGEQQFVAAMTRLIELEKALGDDEGISASQIGAIAGIDKHSLARAVEGIVNAQEIKDQETEEMRITLAVIQGINLGIFAARAEVGEVVGG